jgi:hypothetical protein
MKQRPIQKLFGFDSLEGRQLALTTRVRSLSKT